jgi:hypothetical protein
MANDLGMANRHSTSQALDLSDPLPRLSERRAHFLTRRRRPWVTHGVVAAVGTWALLPFGAAATESSDFVLTGGATAFEQLPLLLMLGCLPGGALEAAGLRFGGRLAALVAHLLFAASVLVACQLYVLRFDTERIYPAHQYWAAGGTWLICMAAEAAVFWFITWRNTRTTFVPWVAALVRGVYGGASASHGPDG